MTSYCTYATVILFLNLLIIPSYCMFKPAVGKRQCIDVKEYFAVDEDDNGYEDDENSFFHVENLEDSEVQEDQKTLVGGKIQADLGYSGNVNQKASNSNDVKIQIQKDQKASGSQEDQKTSNDAALKIQIQKDQKASGIQKDQKTSTLNLKTANDAALKIQIQHDQKASGSQEDQKTSTLNQKTSDNAALKVQIQKDQKASGIQKDQKTSQGVQIKIQKDQSSMNLNQNGQMTSRNIADHIEKQSTSNQKQSQNLEQDVHNLVKFGASGTSSLNLKDQKTSANLKDQKTSNGVQIQIQKDQNQMNVDLLIPKSQKVKIQADLSSNDQKTSNFNLKASGSQTLTQNQMTSQNIHDRIEKDSTSNQAQGHKLAQDVHNLMPKFSGVSSGGVVSNLNMNQNTQKIQSDLSMTSNLNLNQKTSGIQFDATCQQAFSGNCEAGWRSFQRPSGEWCMKIFYENSIIQSVAEQRCQAQGATLSGLQNQMESQFVFSTVTLQIYPQTGSIWVGLKRRKDCLTVGITRNCTAFSTFEWTDNSATGTDGLAWACNQPDNARGRSQHCATLTASYAGTVLGFQTGLLDDVGCDFDYVKNNRKARDVKAFVCGKKPKV